MKKWEMKIPQDITMREGMKTLYADKEDTRVNYIKDVVYVKREKTELHLQLLIPGLHAPQLGYIGKHPLVILYRVPDGENRIVIFHCRICIL